MSYVNTYETNNDRNVWSLCTQKCLAKVKYKVSQKHLIPVNAFKQTPHCGEGVMIIVCSAATGPGILAVIEIMMDSTSYQKLFN